MSKKAKTILLILIFALILGGAAIAYRYLSKSYGEETSLSSQGPGSASQNDSGDSQDSSSSQEDTSESSQEKDSQSAQDSQSSAPIPVEDFALTDAQGQELMFSDFQGKPTVVNFWTPWCPYCKDEMPYFQAAYDTYQEELNVVMMDVPDSRNTAQDAIDLIQEAGYTFPLYLDTNTESLNTFGVYSYPQTFFFNSQGEFVGRITGAIPNQETLFQFIDQLLELKEGTLY